MTQMRGLLALYWAETVVPPPAPPAEEVCFPPVAAPVTAFNRAAVLSTAFARGTIAVPASPFGRVDIPDCNLSDAGYGDDFGEDYGSGSSDAVCFPPLAAPATIFNRPVLASPAYARRTVAGAAFARVAIPSTDVGVGYGDDYGFGYGGEQIPESLVATTVPAAGYQRQAALGALGVTRSGAPANALARMDEPDCVSRLGYGDDYGFNYGGE